jgi:hypothetical protein
MRVGYRSIEISSLASSLSIIQLVPVCQDLHLSDVSSSTADEVSDATQHVDCNCWLRALGDHNQLVEWHAM